MRNIELILGGRQRALFSLKRSDRFWGTPSLLYYG